MCILFIEQNLLLEWMLRFVPHTPTTHRWWESCSIFGSTFSGTSRLVKDERWWVMNSSGCDRERERDLFSYLSIRYVCIYLAGAWKGAIWSLGNLKHLGSNLLLTSSVVPLPFQCVWVQIEPWHLQVLFGWTIWFEHHRGLWGISRFSSEWIFIWKMFKSIVDMPKGWFQFLLGSKMVVALYPMNMIVIAPMWQETEL